LAPKVRNGHGTAESSGEYSSAVEDLRGKTVLLTGASTGLGPHIARRLHQAGAKFVLSARNGEALQRLAKELSYTSGGVVLALGVEEGALVRYTLYDRGAAVDEYASLPEFRGPLPPGEVIALGANPTVVARLTGAEPARVREIARTASSPADLPPALELHQQIAELMGVQV